MLKDEAFGKDQRQLQRQLMGGLNTLRKIMLMLSQQVVTTRFIWSFRSCPPRPRVTPRGGTSFSWFRRHWMGGRSCAGTGHPRSFAVLSAVVHQGGQPGKFSLLPGGPGASRRLQEVCTPKPAVGQSVPRQPGRTGSLPGTGPQLGFFFLPLPRLARRDRLLVGPK